MTFDPPSLSKSPEWATGLARIDYCGGLDLRPYYWVSKDKYQRCTSKNTSTYRPAMGKSVLLMLKDVAVIAAPNGKVRIQMSLDEWDKIQEVVNTLGE